MDIPVSMTPHTARFSVVFECSTWADDVEAVAGTVDLAQDYGSQAPFAPVITVTLGAATESVQVTHTGSGRFVHVADAFAAGDVLVFDMSAGKVTRNGVTIMPKVSIDSVFFAVPPGLQTVTVTTDADYVASMTYRRRYYYA